MIHLIVLLMVVAVGAPSGEPHTPAWLPEWGRAALESGSDHAALVTPLGFVAILALYAPAIALCVRRIDRTGKGGWVRTADRALLLAQWCTLLWLACCSYAFGWVGSVRARTGDLIGVDEALGIAPAILTLALLWLLFWPVERRIRDATRFGRLASGEPVHPPAGRLGYAGDQLRTHAGPTLISALLLFGWIECVDVLSARMSDRLGDAADAVTIGVLALGSVAIVAVLPVVWRFVWRTRRLPTGELRDELTALCERHRVRVADLLVWETRGVLLNGALVGIVPRLRYIMLTDALLERLHARQVEAVMAHEIAHAKHRHIPWLIATVLVSIGLVSAGVTLAIDGSTDLPDAWRTGIAAVVSISGAVLVLGFVSRLFERQADAFAAQHLALVRTGEDNPGLDEEDARGMSDALEGVARFNHIPPDKFSFRHGSIRARQRRLSRLAGVRREDVPVDGWVRWMKRAVLAGGAALAFVLWRFPEAGTLL
ncbi:MAG: M48 family metallopeptidase [Planctomycetota bacterium]